MKGLSKLYQVSCEELDFLVDHASAGLCGDRCAIDGWRVWRMYYKYCG
jgi:galactokinase